MPEVAALYVETDGVYYGIPGVDPWDLERDARSYAGPHPVVAHPPCGRWAIPLSLTNRTRYGHAIGSDGGCFAHAMWAVRTFGGVLEHPANTAAWDFFGLPKPRSGDWAPAPGGGRYNERVCGWVTEVTQLAYGHLARKRTWLLYAGVQPPPSVRWSTHATPRGACGGGSASDYQRLGLRRLSKQESKATPEPFRNLLLALALHSRADGRAAAHGAD